MELLKLGVVTGKVVNVENPKVDENKKISDIWIALVFDYDTSCKVLMNGLTALRFLATTNEGKDVIGKTLQVFAAIHSFSNTKDHSEFKLYFSNQKNEAIALVNNPETQISAGEDDVAKKQSALENNGS